MQTRVRKLSPRSERFFVRLTKPERRAIVRAARSAGRTDSEWVREAIRAAIGDEIMRAGLGRALR